MFDCPTMSRMALSATSLTVILGVHDVEEVMLGILDAPKHNAMDVDDVLIAGQHQAFQGHVDYGSCPRRRACRSR